MGAYTPTPAVSDAMLSHIERDIFVPVLDGLNREGIEYRGILYAGLMLTTNGPKVLEFNCRFGDPETQVLVPRMPYDLAALLHACARGWLPDATGHAGFDEGAAVTVVLASGGYPGAYETGLPIEGLADAGAVDDAIVFHAGTARARKRVVTAGGRVLAVTGTGPTIERARSAAYEAADRITFEGKTYRRDIAARPGRPAGEEHP
jgi:phosphoribosylamine--glycine ligase